MLHLFLLFIIWTVYPAPSRAYAAQGQPTAEPPQVGVRSPQPGQALQGSVPVVALLPGEGFQAAELSFSYDGDERDTRFLIAEIEEPAESGELALWDTTTLTDGVYSLRLAVQMTSGEQATVVVPGLRVRNYTPIETNTPAPPTAALPEAGSPDMPGTQSPTAVVNATLPASPDPFTGPSGPGNAASPEPLPTNPAQVSNRAVAASLGKGALAAVTAFTLLAIYREVQQVIRNRRGSG